MLLTIAIAGFHRHRELRNLADESLTLYRRQLDAWVAWRDPRQLPDELAAIAVAAGDFRTDLPLDMLVMHLQFAHLATMLRCLADPRLSLAGEFATMLDLVCGGLEQGR